MFWKKTKGFSRQISFPAGRIIMEKFFFHNTGQVSFGIGTRQLAKIRKSEHQGEGGQRTISSVVFGNRLASVRAECEILFDDIQWRMIDPADRGNVSTEDAEGGCSWTDARLFAEFSPWLCKILKFQDHRSRVFLNLYDQIKCTERIRPVSMSRSSFYFTA